MTIAPEFPDTILAVTQKYGLTTKQVKLLSPMGFKKGTRIAYKVDSQCGKVIKVREFESEAIAIAICELRCGLPPAFARVLHRYGSVLVEEWIEGTELSHDIELSRLAEAGKILGALHSQPTPKPEKPVATREWRSNAEADLDLLTGVHLISGEVATSLREQLISKDPVSSAVSCIHFDYCAENMLIDNEGALRIIDNERLSVAPAGLDLGWTFFRWPAARRQQFHAAYRDSARSVPEATGFWCIVAALIGARVYLRCAPQRLPYTIELLCNYADDGRLPLEGMQ